MENAAGVIFFILTWFIIPIIAIFAWCNTKRKKQMARRYERETRIRNLPPYEIFAKPDLSNRRFLNYLIPDKELLSEVCYSNGNIHLATRAGTVLNAPLQSLRIEKIKQYGITEYHINCPMGRMVITRSNNFTPQEWDQIDYTFSLAGWTSGSLTYTNKIVKGVKTANTIMKIYKMFS